MKANPLLVKFVSLCVVITMLVPNVALAFQLPTTYDNGQDAWSHTIPPANETSWFNTANNETSSTLAALSSFAPDGVVQRQSQIDGRASQVTPVTATTGRLLFAPSIDLDGDAASNPVFTTPAPVIDLLGHIGGAVMLAAQLEPDDPDKAAIGVPVTFRLWRDNALQFEQTMISDAWGAVSVEVPFANVTGEFAYQASAPGFGETETRRFFFDPTQVSHTLHPDGAELAYAQQGNRLTFTLHSPIPLEAGRDEAVLFIMRRPVDNRLPINRPLPEIANQSQLSLVSLPLPDLPMTIVDAHTATVVVQLPPGDYGMVASLVVNGTAVEQFHSQPMRLALTEETRPSGKVIWASPVEYEPGQSLVQRQSLNNHILFDLMPTAELPLIDEQWDGQSQLLKVWRTGPFEWQEELYDIQVETFVDDGKKAVILQNFDYDPITRRYTLAIKSLHNEVITDTLRVDVLGPNEIVIKQEVAGIVLKPGQTIYYTVEVPAELGKPEGLHVTIDDPLIEKFKALEAAVKTLYGAVSTKGTFNSFFRLYAEIFNVDLIEYTYRYPPGSSHFSFEFFEELQRDPWELLVRLGGGALDGFRFNFWSLIFFPFKDEKDLDKLLDELFRFEIGGIGIDWGKEIGFTATADFGKCPEDADIQQLEQRLAEIADRLDRLVADRVDFSSPSVYKIPLHAIVAINLRLRLRLGGHVSAEGLTLRATGQGSIGATGRLAIALGFGWKQGAWYLVAQQLGALVNGVLVWVDVINIINEVINLRIPDGDCDPDPPDPRPPDDRQDVWQGVEAFYQGQTHDETINNLSELIRQAREQGLGRVERLLTLRLREAELARFLADQSASVAHLEETFAVMENTDLDLQAILSGTIPLDPSQTITEALTIRYMQAWDDLEALPYPHEQQQLLDAVEVAQRRYLELQNQELELQHELRQLLTGDTIGVIASGFAEATLSALAGAGLPGQLISPWAGSGQFRGKPAPYFAPDLAPRAMILPSGGMHAIANSPGARDWLDAYVAGGGLLIVFSQAFGSDWRALPGGQMNGVGYEEDQRWQHATVEAGMPSDWLVWMGIKKPDIQVDGAFTAWPENANLLLKRTFGAYAGSPVMIEYPHGLGTVLATTAYGDWAWQTNFWWGDDARMTHSLMSRAYLLARGQDVSDAFAADPASTVVASFPIDNSSTFDTTSVEVVLPVRLGYWGRDYSETVPLALEPGESGMVTVSLPTPPVMRGVHDWTQVGLYRLRVTVNTADGQRYATSAPFVYVRSPVAPPPLAVRLETAVSTANLFQTVAVTATVRNYTAIARTVVISDQKGLPTIPVTLTVPPNGTASHVYNLVMDSSKTPSVGFYDEDDKLVGRASLALNIAYPQLRATPLPPTTLDNGAVIPVVVHNSARQGQALAAALALSLTTPSGVTIWTADQLLPPLAAGQTITPTFTVDGLASELGVYQLQYRVDDGRGLARASNILLPSRLTLDASLDRVTYRLRDTGELTVVAHNSGRFQLFPTLTVAAPELALNDSQALNIGVNSSQTRLYPFTIPDTLLAGTHPITVSYQVGSQTMTRVVSVIIPLARVRPSLAQDTYTAGDTIVVNLSNDGGVDAPVTAVLQLTDRRGRAIASSSETATILAGQSVDFSLVVPDGAVSGEYELVMTGEDTAVNSPFTLRRQVTVTGLSGDLTVWTEYPAYFSDEDITALATFTATGLPVSNGSLDLKICVPAPSDIEEPSEPPAASLPTTLDDPVTTLDIASFTPLVGSPLSINVATDGSYQVIHDAVNPSTPGQVYWTQADIADAGIFLWYDGYVIGPDFANHPSGSASNSYDPWTNAGQSGVTGAGMPDNPWVIETGMVHADSGATMTSWTSYVNGEDYFRLDWQICLPQPASVSTFLAADYYLQGSDSGYGYYDPESGSVGGYNQAQDWFQVFTPIRPASHYYEANYRQVWNAIGQAGAPGPGFNDTLDPFLIDNGGGLQWDLTINTCSTINAFWSFGETPTIPPVEPPFQDGCGSVLWETTLPLSTTTTLNVTEVVDALDTTGRLLLWGQANSETGQPVAAAQYPFYLHDRDTALTLETDRAAYQPGETVTVTGVVSNTSNLSQTMTLEVYANGYSLISQPLTLAPGESYSYATDTYATIPLALTAMAANAEVAAYPLVAYPDVMAELIVPELVGREPFSVTLVMTNTGLVDAAVQTTLAGQSGPDLLLTPGEVAVVSVSLSISEDTIIEAEISGDVGLWLSQMVLQGEQAELLLWSPDTAVAGLIELPYELSGTGLLPVTGQLLLEIDGAPVLAQEVAVLDGQTINGVLPVDIAAGQHTVTAQLVATNGALLSASTLDLTLQAAGQAAVPDIRLLDLTLSPSPVAAGGSLTVNLELANEGAAGPVIVGLQLFDVEQQWVITPTGFSVQTFTFNLDIPADVPGDDYFGEVTVDGQSQPFTVAVAGTAIAMSLALDEVVYFPNDLATLTVTLSETAGISGDYLLMSRYLGAEEYITVTVPANQVVQHTFSFTATEAARVNVFLANTAVPPAYDRRVLLLDSLPVPVAQPDLGAYLAFDKLVYQPGDTINATVHVTGTLNNVIVMGPMELAFRQGGFLLWQSPRSEEGLGLVISSTYPLSYTLPATLRAGRYTFLLRIDGQVYEHPVDVEGWKVTTRHITLDKARYAQEDEVTAVVEFWNEGETAINDLTLRAWVFLPDDGDVLELTPVVSRTVDLQPGLNVFTVSGEFTTPVVGPHRLLINVGPAGAGWRVAGASAQFDVGWAHLVSLTTDRGNYAPGEPGIGRLDVYGFGPTQLQVTASDGSDLLNTQVDLAGFSAFTFAIPTDQIGDYLLIAQSSDRNGASDQLIRAYAVPAARDTEPPALQLTYPNTRTIITSAAMTTTILVTGQATDDRGPVTVLVNGEVVTPTADGSFSLPLELIQGFNTVSVVALDGAGNITFSPSLSVIVMPAHAVNLVIDQVEARVGQPLTFIAVLSATQTINNVTLADLLPGDLVAAPIVQANHGEVTVDGLGIIWRGDVASEPPTMITIQVTPLVSGILTRTVSVFWGNGVIQEGNEVAIEVLPAIEPTTCELYPIALHQSTLSGVAIGDIIPNIYNGSQPGNFVWLTWTGSKGEPILANSLTPPGDSYTYINPYDPTDSVVSVGDWLRGRPGVANSSRMRAALDVLKTVDIVVPVWDTAQGSGSMITYQVSAFAVIRLISYQLPKQNSISAQFLGYQTCQE